MKVKNILVFLPNSLDTTKAGYLKGRKKILDNTEVFYITSDKVSRNIYQSLGYIGSDVEFEALTEDVDLHINIVNGKILIKHTSENEPLTRIIYDYKRLRDSDILHNNTEIYGQHFKYLCRDIRKCVYLVSNNGRDFITKFLLHIIFIIDICLNVTSKLHKIVEKSSTFMHFEENVSLMKWFLASAIHKKKLSPKMGNVVIIKLVDIIIGILLTNYVVQYENQIFIFLYNSIEGIISSLKGLLFYLMGSPIGLKLNYGFNNFLGQFFLYHISLWRIFLHGTYPVLTSYFKYLMLPGILGFSYQIAMMSDILAIATFHSYCIYVNGARLFNLQLKCLTSLWRVLIGRKFNPLRGRVDSCQYSQNQMFIGTLSFSILLFLLPTTAMYYVVFSVFRLVTLLIDRFLLTARNLFYNIPIYSIYLWLVNASSVAGNIHIIWKGFDEVGNVIIEAKLNKLPFIYTIKKFTPDPLNKTCQQKNLGDIFRSILTGVVL
ncbi:uncharacterized protein LOC130445409 isoform X1 [Diorhabda sublineata]|uniref:uncharacterized protein LOC130445409 isoform X1 n=2 Tax=Diorhabda sublineata TaxID=1163346 RepID=UPI0024E061FB|nr:uncharacterized protein LOC130445409 isoform X1 [Diorhabda sublineata]